MTETLNTDRLAVIVTCYNQESFIEQCLMSIIHQVGVSNVMIYVHDDASTDGTREKLRQLEQQYENIVLLLSQVNKLSCSRSPILETLRIVNETFVAFCNGDDYWIDSGKLKKQLRILKVNPSVGMVHSDYFLLFNESPDLLRSGDSWQLRRRSLAANGMDFIRGCEAKESTVMIRRDAVDFNFLRYADYIVASDWILYLSISQNFSVSYLSDPMVVHRITKEGVYNGSTRARKDMIKEQVYWFAAANLTNLELRKSLRILLAKRVLSDYVRSLSLLSFVLRITRPLRNSIKRFLVKTFRYLILKKESLYSHSS